jgi:hypothetical protein
MTNRSHPRLAVVVWLAASIAAWPAASADDRSVVQMEPARAAKAALAPRLKGPPRTVKVEIESPANGAIFSDEPFTHVSGQLEAAFGAGRVDAVVVIDTSASTSRLAYREDRVLQRVRGRNRWKRPPSILAQELHSAWLLLDANPSLSRLGIVSFAGSPEGRRPDPALASRTEVPITQRRELLKAGLQRIAQRGAAGRTDMAAGLDRAVAELTGRGRSRPDRAAAKVVVFFTDGTPTLPHRSGSENERAVFEAAERAAAKGVRVFSFAIGPEALRQPKAAVEMARRTAGAYTPVRDPLDLTKAVKEKFQLASLGQLSVRNATIQANAVDLRVNDDGSFGGRVPLRPGKNRILIRATAGNATGEASRWVHYAPGSVAAWVAPRREAPGLPMLTGQKKLEVTAAREQGRSLELSLRAQRKELEIGVGEAPPPAARKPGAR